MKSHVLTGVDRQPLLLDTHALLWWLADDAALGRRARAAMASMSNTVAVSAASA